MAKKSPLKRSAPRAKPANGEKIAIEALGAPGKAPQWRNYRH